MLMRESLVDLRPFFTSVLRLNGTRMLVLPLTVDCWLLRESYCLPL